MYQKPLSASAWRSRIQASKNARNELVRAWSENVDYRRGKAFAVESDQDRINVNLSWSLTKAKHAQLFSQTPSVVLIPKRDDLAAVMPAFSQAVNDYLTKANVGAAVDEAVLDVINASGIGVVLVSYEARTEEVELPAVNAVSAALYKAVGKEVPTTKATRTTSKRFLTKRLSPSDLLWPVEFTGSDFDQAPWIGRSGRVLWSEAKTAFKLKDEDRETICGADRVLNLRDDHSQDTQGVDAPSYVDFDEMFYAQTEFDPDAKYFHAIQRLVFVNGKNDPVVDEPWNGQQFDEQTGRYLGSCKFPIRILTLTYMSDDAIPPSDTAIGRPQENELIQARTQMMKQRDRSMPMRWFDPNRVDPSVQVQLMRGEIQGMVPVVNGATAVGEVARASYPPEDFTFDRIAKSDLSEQWSLSANQLGQFAQGERSATEASVIQRGNEARIGYERSRVGAFFCGIAELMAGLLALYGDLQLPIDPRILTGEFTYTIRPDSTVLLDANTRLDQLNHYLNLTAKSGLIDVTPILAEMTALVGLDPTKIVRQPEPPRPEPVNISVRSAEDLTSPLFLALLVKSGQAPTADELQAAVQMIQAAGLQPQLVPLQSSTPRSPQPNVSDWGPMDRITKRVEEVGG